MNTAIQENLTANGSTESITVQDVTPVQISGLTDAGAGSVLVERSLDNGKNFSPVKLPDLTTDAAFTSDASFNLYEDAAVEYRFTLSGYSSGTISIYAGYKAFY